MKQLCCVIFAKSINQPSCYLNPPRDWVDPPHLGVAQVRHMPKLTLGILKLKRPREALNYKKRGQLLCLRTRTRHLTKTDQPVLSFAASAATNALVRFRYIEGPSSPGNDELPRED